jgi:hypothetical protein
MSGELPEMGAGVESLTQRVAKIKEAKHKSHRQDVRKRQVRPEVILQPI